MGAAGPFTILLLLCTFLSAQTAIRYKPVDTGIPADEIITAAINDKGQIAYTTAPDSPNGLQILLYLPEDDYNLSAGTHVLKGNDPNYRIYRLIQLTNSGELIGELWGSGRPNMFYATRNRTIINLGDIQPLNLSEDGIVYGIRQIQGNDSEIVAFDTNQGLVTNTQSTFEAAPHTGFNSVFHSILDANSNGTFLSGRIGFTFGRAFPQDRTDDPFTFAFDRSPLIVPGFSDSFGIVPPVPIPFTGFPEVDLEAFSNQLPLEINDKGQITGTQSSPVDGSNGFIYLPTADYGLPAGVTLIPDFGFFQPFDFTESGDILLSGQQVWRDGEVFYPTTRLNGTDTVTQDTIRDINNNSDVLLEGSFNGAANTLIILENDVKVTATVTAEPRFVSLNETFYLTVQIHNTSDRAFATTGVWTLGIDGTSFNGLLQLDNPPPAPSLDPGETFTMVFPFQATQLGKVQFTVVAAGFFPDGTLNLTESITTDEIQVGNDPLTIQLEAIAEFPDNSIAPIQNMEVFEDPNNPGQFIVTDSPEDNSTPSPIQPKLKVTLTNNWDKDVPVSAVIQGLDPRARDRTALAGRLNVDENFPLDIGSISPGESVEEVFDLNIVDDGRFEFDLLVTSVETGTTEQYISSITGAPIAVGDPYPVQLELEVIRTPVITNSNNGAAFIQPGGYLRVLAAVDNLTTNSTLEFYGIKAKKSLNAFGCTLTSEDGNLNEPAFAHTHTVDAGSSAILSGIIRTDKDGAPSGLIEWQGLENIKLIDDQTGDETDLTMDDVLVKTTGAKVTGWGGDPLALRVIQDNSRPSAPALNTLEIVAIRTGHYSYGALIGMSQWTYDTFDAIGGLGRLAGYVYEDPDLLANAMGQASRAVWEAAGLVANTWSEMTPEQKEEFVQSLVGEVVRRSALLATGQSPIDVNDLNAAAEYTRNATFFLFDGVTQAYASDDPARIAEVWGNVSGHVAMEVITAAISEVKFTKYIDGAEALKLLDNTQLGPALNDQEALLRSIKSGPLSKQKVLEAFGPGPEDVDAFQKVFKAFGVKGYARERAPLSYELINQRGVAIWKPESMKPKGISDIDLLLFGEPVPVLAGSDGNPVNLKAITGIFWPDTDDVLRTRLANQPPEVLEACLARAKKRRKEFSKYFPEFLDWKDNGIPVKRNYKDNGVPDPAGQGNPTRNFEFEFLQQSNGREIFIPKMADANGNLKFISGDIDWVHFSFLDGSPLDSKTARQLYDVLMDCCGLQHPETVTWINKGQSLFETKIDQIADYLTGEKALLEISGEGPRAVRMNQKLTRFADGRNARNHLIVFDDGIVSRERFLQAKIETAFHNLRSRTPARLFPPFLWATKNLDPETNTTIGNDEFLFDSLSDALLLRNNADGNIEQFDGQNWVPFISTSPAPNNEGGPRPNNESSLTLTPTSGLTENVSAGSTTLPVMDLPSLWPTQMAGRVNAWFAPGQTLLIAPGEPSQETHTILSINPITLTSPLAHDHPEDTIVAVLPSGLTLSSPQSSLITTINEGDFTSLLWSTLPARQYQLEVQNGSSWSPLGDPLFSGDNTLATPVANSEYNPSANYRLTEIGLLPEPLTITQFSFSPSTGNVSLQWATEPGQTYLVETSTDLTPNSWTPTSAQRTATTNLDQITIPVGSQLNQFFRISSPSSSNPDAINIISFSKNTNESNVTISWSTNPGDTYQVYHSPNNLLDFNPIGSEITASGSSASLNLPIESSLEKAFFQIRKVAP
ncbi:MAG: hypothetical protein AAGC74_01740 [Verrucomicrobiota bacterium]